jgi:hypothetical protein
MKTILNIGIMAVATALAVPQASALTFQLNTEFSGGRAPAGPPPWLTATFTDTAFDTVHVTLSASGLTGSENVSEWDFNVTDSFVGTLNFTNETKGGTFDSPTILQGLDAFQADGDGKYDLSFVFTTGGVASSVFGPGETLEYDSTNAGLGLTASDFNLLSADAGGHGPFFTAAHVQNTTGAGTGDSGWIAAIPEPSATLLIPVGGLLGFLLRFRSKK